jgi:uncharacterized protein YeeX (DUF496 family)
VFQGVGLVSTGSRESKLQRFERLAQKRVTEALRRLRLVGNLSNRINYEYSDEHVRQLVDALEAELKQLKSRFRQEGSGAGQTFSFKKRASRTNP